MSQKHSLLSLDYYEYYKYTFYKADLKLVVRTVVHARLLNLIMLSVNVIVKSLW